MSWLTRLNPFNYLAGRIFIWFWLVIVLAIASTLLLSGNFSDRTEILPIPPHLKQQLNRQLQRRSDASTLEKLLKEAKHPRNQWLVVDREQQHLLNPDQLERPIDNNWLTELANLGEPRILRYKDLHIAGPFLFRLQGKTYAVYQQRIIPDEPWWKLHALSEHMLFTLLLVFSLIASLLLALSISRPLRNLLDNQLAFAVGGLDSRADKLALRKDELGKLGQGFNTMADRISALLHNQQRLLRDVSHELRSPLTRAELAISLEETQQNGQYLPRIRKELQTIDSLLDELLTYSRLDAGQYPLDKQAVDIAGLITGIIDVNQVEADSKQQHLQLHTQNLPPLNADQRLLARAIENILRNAMKYSPENSIIDCRVDSTGNRMNIRICDQGPGISEIHLAKIFQPFYRVSDSRNNRTGGTGLGLAIAAQAVRQHHGKISASNLPDGGLCVQISLPLAGKTP